LAELLMHNASVANEGFIVKLHAINAQ